MTESEADEKLVDVAGLGSVARIQSVRVKYPIWGFCSSFSLALSATAVGMHILWIIEIVLLGDKFDTFVYETLFYSEV